MNREEARERLLTPISDEEWQRRIDSGEVKPITLEALQRAWRNAVPEPRHPQAQPHSGQRYL